MSRDVAQRLDDVMDAIVAIKEHVQRGDFSDGLVFDAVRMRLIEIGEALKDVDPNLLAREDHIPWRDITGMRDHLAHHYFDTLHSIVRGTVEHDLPALEAAIKRLRDRIG